VEPALVDVVDLKFFCGFSFAEIASMKDVSERTVQRNWEKARIYLHRKIVLICRFEKSMSTLRRDQWQALSPYLDQALTLTEDERRAWPSELAERDP
jgi:hypothetical protein